MVHASVGGDDDDDGPGGGCCSMGGSPPSAAASASPPPRARGRIISDRMVNGMIVGGPGMAATAGVWLYLRISDVQRDHLRYIMLFQRHLCMQLKLMAFNWQVPCVPFVGAGRDCSLLALHPDQP
jgi:hypothetical protein